MMVSGCLRERKPPSGSRPDPKTNTQVKRAQCAITPHEVASEEVMSDDSL